MALNQSKGALEQRDVDRALDEQVQALTPCYKQAGAAQRYAGGNVKLRFFVASTGDVSNVLVVESDLGNFEVERCLVAEGRRLKFPAPEGQRATDFEYSLRFQSSGERKVVQWDRDVLARDVAHLTGHLATCGSLGPSPVRAVVYIQPGGTVGSVGLACSGPIDAQASACAVEQIRKWRLRDDRRHIVRTSFLISTAGASSASAASQSARARFAKRPRSRG